LRHIEYHYGTKTPEGKLMAGTFRQAFDAIKPGPVRLLIEADIPRKSAPQNNLLHHLFRVIAGELNREGMGDGHQWTVGRIKTYCKGAGLYPMAEVLMPGGELIEVPKDTAELDRQEISDTIDRVRVHFFDLGLDIPERGDQMELGV